MPNNFQAAAEIEIENLISYPLKSEYSSRRVGIDMLTSLPRVLRNICLRLILQFTLIYPICAFGVEDVRVDSAGDLYNSCKLLSLPDGDCKCVLQVSSELNDGDIASRMSLGFIRRDDEYLKGVAKEAENSEFYQGQRSLTAQDKKALLIERINQFDMKLKRTCDITLKKLLK